MCLSPVEHTVIFEFITLIMPLEIITFHGSYHDDGLCIGKVHVTGICTAYGDSCSLFYFSFEPVFSC